MAALISEFRCRHTFDSMLIHTGQHFSPEMSKTFFEDLELPHADLHLGTVAGSSIQQIASIMQKLEAAFQAEPPSMVLVVGDVSSTLAATLAAAQMHIPIAHVEAGLRSFDRKMPEELNRVVTDSLSDYLFVTEESGRTNLLTEGIAPTKIHFVGNVMIDTLLRFRKKANRSGILADLALAPKTYAVATLHRPSNVDDPGRLSEMLRTLIQISKLLPVVFPVHPRTRKGIHDLGVGLEQLIVTEPLGYLDFLHLMANARLVLTDSGGIQEETTILGVPCLTARENTERPVTIREGTNRLVGVDSDTIVRTAAQILSEPHRPTSIPDLWDGRASERIADILERELESREQTGVPEELASVSSR
jgi:UDP-N-acetylglucosamine 2-epimerase (non-hydrolysing)